MTNQVARGKSTMDYEKLVQSEDFKGLVKRKQNFSRPYVVFFFAAYFLLPLLTGYTKILEKPAIGAMTWTWIYAFSMFVMVWIFTSIYMNKAKQFDIEVDKIIEKNVLK
ncbi:MULTISPECIES: DUF485 domain-containing protein [unclassified Sporosarcina]|uniref:DUF485 domain-containing protein n=1 Tax=unclassified Sporosarcina TaxID=2647733 RepID=UPI000C170897|nr:MULTISPECIES: DUF485 domain-containing protein [unclassified Sporosarcina]PID00845.1 hypothetical protein CSV68_01075 [Sporosarcina sp. P29]PID07096.1 hypothetical protein CSV66_00495 [Sporosarcina sp. P30]PID10292.1 hypothetical protein CSV65_00500 [Sporosarcina sp. P31]PID12190.1 hypothetical protein CSV64_08495 [Sporosarcina sp. P32b]